MAIGSKAALMLKSAGGASGLVKGAGVLAAAGSSLNLPQDLVQNPSILLFHGVSAAAPLCSKSEGAVVGPLR